VTGEQVAASDAATGFLYNAFISYSHAADGKLAPALQSGLQRFAKPWYRMRALRVFRDQASLSANPNLWSSIQDALDGSEFFVFLASPEAAASVWCGREAERWRATKPTEKLLIGLTDGDLVWNDAANDFDWTRTNALPDVLRGAFAEEPRYIDLRWAHNDDHLSLDHAQFRDAIAEFAAPLHGKPKDELASEEVRQHRRALRLARGAAAALICLVILALVLSGFAFDQRNVAVSNQHEAQSRQFAAQAEAALATDPEAAAQLALRALDLAVTPEAEAALRDALPAMQVLKVVQVGASVLGAAFSPDGSKILTTSTGAPAALWDVKTGAKLRTFGVTGVPVQAAWFTANGAAVITNPVDDVFNRTNDYAAVWETATGRELRHFALCDSACVARPDGTLVETVTGIRDPTGLELVDASGNRGAVIPGADPVSVSIDRDGQHAVTTNTDGSIAMWDLRRRQLESTWKPSFLGARSPLRAALSLDARVVLSDGGPGTIDVWDASTHVLRQTLIDPSRALLNSASFSADGRFIVGASADGTARVWNTATGFNLTGLLGHVGPVTTATFSPDGREVLTGSADGTVRIWDATPREQVAELDAQAGGSAAACSASGVVATLARDRVVRIWNAADGKLARKLNGKVPSGALGIAVTAGAQQIVTASLSGVPTPRSMLGRSPDGTHLVRFADPPGGIGSEARPQLSYSADGALVMETGADGIGDPSVWNAHTGKAVSSYQFTANDVALSPDGREFIAATSGGTALVVDTQTKRVITSLQEPQKNPVNTVIFSDDGRYVATGSNNGYVRLFDARTFKQRLAIVEPRGSSVTMVRFSPDGTSLVTAARDGTMRIWNATNGVQQELLGGANVVSR